MNLYIMNKLMNDKKNKNNKTKMANKQIFFFEIKTMKQTNGILRVMLKSM